MSVTLFVLLFCCFHTLNIFYTFVLIELFWKWSANCKINKSSNDLCYFKNLLSLQSPGLDCKWHDKVRWIYLSYFAPTWHGSRVKALQNGVRNELGERRTRNMIVEHPLGWWESVKLVTLEVAFKVIEIAMYLYVICHPINNSLGEKVEILDNVGM